MHSNAALHGTCQGTECIFKSIGEQNILLHSKKTQYPSRTKTVQVDTTHYIVTITR